MKPETLAVHAGADIDHETAAVSPPIHLSTTFEHPADVGELKGYLYGRYGNPTQDRLESALAALEGGALARVFASGMAAANALLQNLPAGGHVLMADDCYFSVRRLAQAWFPRWGLTLDLVDMTDAAAVRAAMRPNTCCLWVETPSNPLLKLSAVAPLAQIARAAGALLVVDATFATPLLLTPLALGADVVMHSTTKYLGGHSDVSGGALVFAREDALAQAVGEIRTLQGAIASPFASWLVLRGLRTLAPRLDWHQRNAMAVAHFLAAHPRVSAVHYPGLASHPQHALVGSEMRGPGGMLSFEVAGTRADAIAVAARLKLFVNATSLGGYESLVEHRQSSEGAGSPTPETLLRLSVGLEHADDLIADLDQALAG
ncbi:MAG: PLP-dependent transferase [Xanthomonadales bacterium]|nr:Cystathionine gamma-synthase [Xanthomonadales bacterium]MCC6592531.1 PLP-dependent transferase [Xanthomonadales bacterium]MCE7931489.1 cystathionine gamma-synthase [Xanthomonadales bacterium PRO6]